MRRDEFMKELEYLLQDIPDEDKADAIAYYQDYLEEAGPEKEEEVIRDFGSPERVAAIIRADICGNLEDGGEFTEKGYEDERFREPNFQLVKRQEASEAAKDKDGPKGEGPQEKKSARDPEWDHGYTSGGSDKAGAGRNYGSGLGSGYGSGMTSGTASVKPEKARWEWWQILGLILLGCCVLPVLIPLVFGVGGGAIGLIFGLGAAAIAVLATLSIGLAAVTLVLLLGGIALIILFFSQLGAGFVQGALCLGTGVGILGLGFLCLSLCGLYYGIFLPWLVKSSINLIHRMIHRKEAAK